MKKILLAFCYFVLMSSMVNADDKFRLGVILHLTGDLAMQSAAFREGIEIAVAEENLTKPGGMTIDLVVEDGHNNPKTSNSAAQKLINSNKIDAAIISSYVDAMSSGPSFEKAKVPTITLWDSNPEIEAVGKYVFAIGPWTPSSGEVAARFAKERLGSKSAVVISNQDSWSESVANYFLKDFRQNGGKILEIQSLDSQNTDFRTIITRIIKKNPDVIYSPLVHNIVPFYKQLKQLGISAQIISSDIIATEHILKAPKAFEGVYQTNLKEPDSKTFSKLKETYEERFEKPITLGWFVAVGYDSVKVITQAIRNGGINSVELKKQLYKIQKFPGASSEISFTPEGSSPQFVRTFQVKNGKFKLLLQNDAS